MDEKHDIDDLTLWLEVLQRVADASTNMVVITDPERRILWVNATYVRITGWALAECIGKRPREPLHGPDTSREALDRMADQLRNGEFEELDGKAHNFRLKLNDSRRGNHK